MINQLESKVRSDCIVTKIDEDRCKLTLAKVMPIHLIIDLDKPNAPVSPILEGKELTFVGKISNKASQMQFCII